MKAVLFVDDEPSIRNAIERIYLDRDDVRCLFAASGQDFARVIEIMGEMTESHFEQQLMELFYRIAEEVHANG